MRKVHTLKEFREALAYNHKTGLFYWKVPKRGRQLSKPAGSLQTDGSISICVDYKRYQASLLAWFMFYGEWPSLLVDHKDHNRANNRIRNLRLATRSQNGQNQLKANGKNTTGLLGVSRRRTRFLAKISVNGKVIPLGLFDDAMSAHKCYLRAKRKMHSHNML